jgi:hypothetical protein
LGCQRSQQQASVAFGSALYSIRIFTHIAFLSGSNPFRILNEVQFSFQAASFLAYSMGLNECEIKTGANYDRNRNKHGSFSSDTCKKTSFVMGAFVRMSVETQIKPIYQSDSLRIFDSKEKISLVYYDEKVILSNHSDNSRE